jgi:hypothetical protein
MVDDPKEPVAEEAWERARRLRLEQMERDLAHGEDLARRYGGVSSRPRFAEMKHSRWRRRR